MTAVGGKRKTDRKRDEGGREKMRETVKLRNRAHGNRERRSKC